MFGQLLDLDPEICVAGILTDSLDNRRRFGMLKLLIPRVASGLDKNGSK